VPKLFGHKSAHPLAQIPALLSKDYNLTGIPYFKLYNDAIAGAFPTVLVKGRFWYVKNRDLDHVANFYKNQRADEAAKVQTKRAEAEAKANKPDRRFKINRNPPVAPAKPPQASGLPEIFIPHRDDDQRDDEPVQPRIARPRPRLDLPNPRPIPPLEITRAKVQEPKVNAQPLPSPKPKYTVKPVSISAAPRSTSGIDSTYPKQGQGNALPLAPTPRPYGLSPSPALPRYSTSGGPNVQAASALAQRFVGESVQPPKPPFQPTPFAAPAARYDNTNWHIQPAKPMAEPPRSRPVSPFAMRNVGLGRRS
jgi:hypothetical protein